MSKGSATDIFRVGRGDGFAHLVQGHPVDAHGFRCRRPVAALPYVLRTAPASRRSAFAGMAAIDADHGTVIVAAVRALNGETALEKAMTLKSATLRPKLEHRAAERHRIAHIPSRFLDVFNAPRDASSLQPISYRADQQGMGGSFGARRMTHGRVALTDGRSPNEIVAGQINRQCVGLNEWERVSLVALKIDAYNVKSSPVKAHCRAAGAAKQIKCAWPHRLSSFVSRASALVLFSVLVDRPAPRLQWRPAPSAASVASSLNQRLVGEALALRAAHEAFQPVHGVPLHVAVIQPYPRPAP